MPGVEEWGLFDAAVLWPNVGRDRYAQPRVSAPVEVECRWEDKRSEAVDAEGNTITIDGTVWVNQPIAVGSLMWHGALASLPAGVVPDVMLVKYSNSVNDTKCDHPAYSYQLMRFKSEAVPVS